MNTYYDIEIEPITVTKTINKIKIVTKSLSIYKSVNFMIKIFDNFDNIVEIKYIELLNDEYLLWQNDDTFVKNYILEKLNFIENTQIPAIYDNNDYIINIEPKNIIYTCDKLTISFNSLKLFYNASFIINICNKIDNISLQKIDLVLTNEEYLSWMNDDTFIKNYALQLVNAIEKIL